MRRKKKNELSKECQDWIAKLTDPKGAIRREEIRQIRRDRRRFKNATHHTYRIVFADGEVRTAFARGEREAVILTQASRISGEPEATAGYLDTVFVCMSGWL